jgi:hypothetical protein
MATVDASFTEGPADPDDRGVVERLVSPVTAPFSCRRRASAGTGLDATHDGGRSSRPPGEPAMKSSEAEVGARLK